MIMIETAVVVDDDAQLRKAIECLLGALLPDTRIHQSSARGALAFMEKRQTTPDLFLVRMEVKKPSGLELVREIREHKYGQETAVVLFSEKCAPAEHDAHGFFKWPFTLHRLDGVIRQARAARAVRQ